MCAWHQAKRRSGDAERVDFVLHDLGEMGVVADDRDMHADFRRIGIRRHFDQVEAGIHGAGDGVVSGDHPDHLAFLVDKADAGDIDFIIDARPVIACWRRRWRWAGYAATP